MALLLHYTGQDYVSRGLDNAVLTPGSTSAIVGGCKTGKGFAFDGTANSAMPINAEFQRPDSVSISCWAKASNSIGFKTIFSSGITNVYASFHQYGRWTVRIHNSSISIVLFRIDGTYYDRAVDAEVTEWNHITAIFTPTRIALYVNGSLVSEQTVSGDFRPDWLPILGCLKNTVGGTFDRFNGQICNFKLYNHVLSQKEINEDYKSLMLHYKLDKTITTQVFDHSGFNRHIQVIENTTTNSTTQKRVYGGSLANDGTQSLYGSLNLSEFNGINEISVAVRFRFIAQDGNHCYFSSRTTAAGGGNGISIFKLGGTSRYVFIDIAGRSEFTLPYDLVSGSWYDLVAVKSTTNVKLYINGSLINTISNTNSISNMGQLYASISRSIADDNIELFNAVNGNVQDIRFYAKALTQEDVTELYQTRHEIDKAANGYCYELIEGQSEVEMKANGQLYCDEVIENDTGTFEIVQNKTIKTKEIKEI